MRAPQAQSALGCQPIVSGKAMSFEEASTLLPVWVQYWINFIVAVPIVSVVVFLFSKATRFDALVTFLLTALAFGSTVLLYSQFGMVRLLGLGHIIFWTPLAIYLLKRLRTNPPPRFFAAVMVILLATLVAALVFDYYDVLRWLLGERASIV